MPSLIARIGERLPLQVRILHRQFLLRVVDLESLSIEADIPRFLGQFAGVLIMLSLINAYAASVALPRAPLSIEHYLIRTMMLVVGLIAVVSWDSTFPDRRDVMMFAPLPVKPRTILIAKLMASGSLLGLAFLTLNVAPALVTGLLLGSMQASFFGFFQSLFAYFAAVIGATLFLYCSVLTVQGLTAWLLPRRTFLRLSAALQLAAFGLFIAAYFLFPSPNSVPELLNPANWNLIAWTPSVWFLAILNQLNGTLPPELSWIARRGWIGLGISMAGSVSSLLLCYLRTMKKIVEEPDLVPGRNGFRWRVPFGGALHTAIVTFCIRSLVRSRQHRVAYAFYSAIVFALGLAWLQDELKMPAAAPVPQGFLISTILMLCFAVLGLRSVFTLPISLHANWMLRVTQLHPTARYISATRKTLFLFGVFPVLLWTVILGLRFRPWQPVAGHLVLLMLLGCLMVELGLKRFDRVPFTCSYLPGKANVQVVFWGFVFAFLMLSLIGVLFEVSALQSTGKYAAMTGILTAAIVGVYVSNRQHAKTAVLYFEEVPPEVVTQLGISSLIPQRPVGTGLSSE